jgi:hypothetical protein
MAQPVESSERRAGSKMADLGGRIRRRYLGSPGVLRLENTLGLARRVSRWSSGRLPLLATIQRRWSLAGRPPAGRTSALLYARPPVRGGSRPLAADSAQSMPDVSGRSVGPLDLTPLPGGRVGLQRAVSAPPTTGPPAQRSTAGPDRGAPNAQLASPVSRLGAAILRRHLGGPTARAEVIQRRGASESPPLVHAETQAAPSLAAGVHGPGAPVLRQSMPGSAKGVVQRTPQTAQIEGSAEALPSVGTTQTGVSSPAGSRVSSGARASQPAGGEERPSGPAPARPPPSTAAGNLGTAIVQRHLTGPGAWVIRRQAARSGGTPPGRLISPIDSVVGRAHAATPQISERTVRRAAESLPVADRPVGLQRETDNGFPPALAGVTPPATGEWHPAVENTAASGSRAGLTPLQRAWRPSSRAEVPSGEINVMRQLASPLFRLPRAGVETTGVGLSPRGDSYMAAPDMPLLRMVERGVKSTGDGRAAPDSRTSAGSGTTVDLFLQRAEAGTSVAPPPADVSGTATSPPTGEPFPPGEAMAGAQSMDLERLADQVYAIIERRLIIERESLGL